MVHMRTHTGRVLVVDDCRVSRSVIKRVVQDAGWVCIAVCDGLHAVQAWVHGAYTLIIMDRYMPEMDGKCAVEHIRRNEKGDARVRIVGVSADGESAWEGVDVDLVATKPLSQHDVHKILESC